MSFGNIFSLLLWFVFVFVFAYRLRNIIVMFADLGAECSRCRLHSWRNSTSERLLSTVKHSNFWFLCFKIFRNRIESYTNTHCTDSNSMTRPEMGQIWSAESLLNKFVFYFRQAKSGLTVDFSFSIVVFKLHCFKQGLNDCILFEYLNLTKINR